MEKAEMKPEKKSRVAGRTPSQVMAKHIREKDDVISEEDFKNLIIGADVTNDSSHEPLDIADDTERPKDEDKDPSIITPWDLVS